MTARFNGRIVSVIPTLAAKLCNIVLYHRLGCCFSDGVQAFGGSRKVPVSDSCSCGLRERRVRAVEMLGVGAALLYIRQHIGSNIG